MVSSASFYHKKHIDDAQQKEQKQAAIMQVQKYFFFAALFLHPGPPIQDKTNDGHHPRQYTQPYQQMEHLRFFWMNRTRFSTAIAILYRDYRPAQ